MASYNANFVSIFLLILNCFIVLEAQNIPAMYVFGDSTVDVGNNNYMNTPLVANILYNGIDYAGGRPTGRFSNGKNTADFLAEKVGLPTPPPYLSDTNNLFLRGVSFASGGAGLLNSTHQGQAISFETQVQYFSTLRQRVIEQLGTEAAQQHFSKSLFVVVLGSNDIFEFFNPQSTVSTEFTPVQYLVRMLYNFAHQFKLLHNLGAKKFLVTGTGAVGCTPAVRVLSPENVCSDAMNEFSKNYNQKLNSLLQILKSDMGDINYSFFDTLSVFLNLIKNPSAQGFTEAKAACCGKGKLNAEAPCSPSSSYCPNRNDHLFWDKFHPTEATARLIVDYMMSGSEEHVTPMNFNKLIAL